MPASRLQASRTCSTSVVASSPCWPRRSGATTPTWPTSAARTWRRCARSASRLTSGTSATARLPFDDKFDTIFFSEVLEHLLISSPVVLARLRRCLKPGGVLICTTPNLHRLRNVAYMIMGTADLRFLPHRSGRERRRACHRVQPGAPCLAPDFGGLPGRERRTAQHRPLAREPGRSHRLLARPTDHVDPEVSRLPVRGREELAR